MATTNKNKHAVRSISFRVGSSRVWLNAMYDDTCLAAIIERANGAKQLMASWHSQDPGTYALDLYDENGNRDSYFVPRRTGEVVVFSPHKDDSAYLELGDDAPVVVINGFLRVKTVADVLHFLAWFCAKD